MWFSNSSIKSSVFDVTLEVVHIEALHAGFVLLHCNVSCAGVFPNDIVGTLWRVGCKTLLLCIKLSWQVPRQLYSYL